MALPLHPTRSRIPRRSPHTVAAAQHLLRGPAPSAATPQNWARETPRPLLPHYLHPLLRGTRLDSRLLRLRRARFHGTPGYRGH